MNTVDICNELNLFSTDYVANFGIDEKFISNLQRSCRGVVGVDVEENLTFFRRQNALKGVKLCDVAQKSWDDGAFDKVVYSCRNMSLDLTRLELLYRVTDNGGYILFLDYDGNTDMLIDFVCSKNLTSKDYWVFGSDNGRYCDFLWRVRK